MGSKTLIHWKKASSEVSRSIDEGDLLPIVSVGSDRQLLGLREKILRGAGLPVHSVTPEEAEDLAHSSDTYVWVFCSTVELGSLIYLASAIRRYSPDSKLLLLEGLSPIGSASALFKQTLDPIRVESLLSTIREEAIRNDTKKTSAAGFTRAN